MANLTNFIKAFGESGEYGKFGETGEFNRIVGNVLTNANELARNARSRENGEFDKILPRLLAKAANVVNLAKLAMQWRKWQI